MPREMKLPELGENIEEAEVVSVLVAVGDRVSADQPVIELETDKATAEVPAAFGGAVKQVHVKKGDTVSVGQVILTIDEDAAGAGIAGAAAARNDAPGKAPGKKPPRAGGRRAAAEAAGRRKAGARRDAATTADAGRPAPETQVPQPDASPVAGKTRPPAGETGATGAVPLDAEDAGERQRSRERQHAAERRRFQERQQRAGAVPAAPSVRRLARELGIDIGEVPGSGPGGRVSDDDVKSHARSLLSRRGPAPAAPPSPPLDASLPDFTRWGEVERHAMTGVRRRTAANMARAWRTIPHVTQFDRADITDLETFRGRYGRRVEEQGGKLTITAIVVKVAAAALKAFPRFNSSLDLDNEEILFKKYINIGVAVDTERGLLVPVVHQADAKSLTDIAIEIAELAEKARERKVSPDDLAGASFTVTNLGGLGTTYFSPIVNWPEVAILGIGRAGTQPVAQPDGGFKARLLLPLSVSYDHRVIDGADAARFLRWVAEALEHPLLLALEG